MEQIWLKPRPTHIDEYFEDFILYLKETKEKGDTLYRESIRLLRQRVQQLIADRLETPIYRFPKDRETLTFNVRISATWLLAVKDSNAVERGKVWQLLINNLVALALMSPKSSVGQSTLAHKKVPELLDLSLKMITHRTIPHPPFIWSDIVSFRLDIFVNKILTYTARLTEPVDAYYENYGTLVVEGGKLRIAACNLDRYTQAKLMRTAVTNCFLPKWGLETLSEKNIQIKDAHKDNVHALEDFTLSMIGAMGRVQPSVGIRKLNYVNGERVPVEVVEVGDVQIRLRTIDPAYTVIEGQLVFETTIKIFKSIYIPSFWRSAMEVGDRFYAQVDIYGNCFRITNDFVEYLRDEVELGCIYDSYNRMVEGAWLKNAEFWTTDGFMVFVDITKEQKKQLDDEGGFAVVSVTHFGEGEFRGCVYGEFEGFEVENHSFRWNDECQDLIRDFIKSIGNIKLSPHTNVREELPVAFIHEACFTLNVMQSLEKDPLLRYRILSTICLLSELVGFERESGYAKYIGKYIQTLILFAQQDSNEGALIDQIPIPSDLSDEEAVNNGANILTILSCFAKSYDISSDTLDQYIDGEDTTLSEIASLVQSYNRLLGILEMKTLRDIKRQILNQLSIVLPGDSTLELSKELVGMYGEEDDMKEFKESFMEAPSNAREQRQFLNVFRGVCAMMNNRGGVLYLGVNDKGMPIGLHRDLEKLARQRLGSTLDAFMLYINKLGGEWLGEKCWRYVTLKPVSDQNIICMQIQPYPYDIVYLKDKTTYLRKNNASAPIIDEETKEEIRRQRVESLRDNDAKLVATTLESIQNKRQLRLKGYQSADSQSISVRLVEVFEIEDNEYLQAYDIQSGRVKLFRLSRADEVIITDKPWRFEAMHKHIDLDPFRMSGEELTEVVLELGLTAKLNLVEMYPHTANFITEKGQNVWIFSAQVYSLSKVVRFCVANAPFVTILKGEGLREAIADYLERVVQSTLK